MRHIKFWFSLTIVSIAFYSCQKPIDLKATSTNANILVVEGLINVADSTKINLSRTVIIGNKTTANPEARATVTIENAQATVATLTEIAKGKYASPVLNLDKTKQYRLRIKLANGKTYLSDLTDAKVTPPIDSVGYTVKNNGIQLYVNTHDDTNNSRYYLYNYAETWRFNSKYISSYISNGNALVPRTPAQYIHECYGNLGSANILLNSTAALTQDVAYQFPLTFIDGTSEKISIKYSTLVTQIALTKEAYAFWENLKKSTESLGSIFDAQPSQLIGNIHNAADASEPVIGYISAGTIQTKRIFINKLDLPPSFKTEYPFVCRIDTAKGGDIRSKLILSGGPSYITLWDVDLPPVVYIYSDKPCSDCTIRGTVTQPAFWK
ncbi:hypothetical protein GCM10027049_03960 [Mucilaginibacter puniceus]